MPTRFISDSRMLELMLLLKNTGEVRSQIEFCRVIGALPTDIEKIRRGIMSFNPHQIEMACKEFNVNGNWIFGIERNIFRGLKNPMRVDKLLERLRNTEIKNGRKVL